MLLKVTVHFMLKIKIKTSDTTQDMKVLTCSSKCITAWQKYLVCSWHSISTSMYQDSVEILGMNFQVDTMINKYVGGSFSYQCIHIVKSCSIYCLIVVKCTSQTTMILCPVPFLNPSSIPCDAGGGHWCPIVVDMETISLSISDDRAVSLWF